jgi:creatinine deaminase
MIRNNMIYFKNINFIPHDHEMIERAYQLALKGYKEGGCPIGSVLSLDSTGEILGSGHNMRVQENNPIIHGEMSAIRAAGAREQYNGTTIYTTLSPCMMCAGTIVQFNIPRVVVADIVNSDGNVEFLRARGVEVVILPHQGCIDLVKTFRTEKPKLWSEDWGQEYLGQV